MSLAPGTRLGAYEVISPIGAGGMGEVYRARDTRLHRDVAIKVLPEMFSADADRLARFKREAHVLASLSHPNIASIHGLEETSSGSALVLELVEGPTLAERIARGALPLDEALQIARQIADALEAAHEHGIIHRDLKPANIKLTRDDRVKVLDFGLAKAVEADDGPAKAGHYVLSQSPTITSPAMTHGGMILGTAAYMSPEQARGRPVDKRSDVWAFGCVLYEMLSGRRTFDSSEVSDVLAFVITKEPDWSALPPTLPAAIRKLLRRCLEKDRRRRLADISDARLDIEDAMHASTVRTDSDGIADKPLTGLWRRALPWSIAALALLSAATLLIRPMFREPATRPAFAQVSAQLGADVSLVMSQGPGAILSPDGTTLAFVGQPTTGGRAPQLYIRRVDQLSAQPLNGTDGALNPFFSPDGRWIGFFSGGKLKKTAVAGGGAVTLADAPNGRGASWGDDDHLVFMPDFYTGLWRVSSSGGAPIRLTVPPGGGTDRWPQVLPGSKGVLFTRHTGLTGYENADIVVQPLPDGTPRVVQRGGFYGRYLASGHLTYVQGGALFAAPFDLGRLARTGNPVPVVQDIANGGFWTGAAQFAVSDTGTAVYASGSDSAVPVQWLDGTGQTSMLRSAVANWADPSFSTDGRHLALDIWDGKQSDIWIHELERGRSPRLTVDPGDDFKPVWTTDGTASLYVAREEGFHRPFGSASMEQAPIQRLTSVNPRQLCDIVASRTEFLAFTELSPDDQST